MTMDNGEGRPLDEVEAGNDDPQGWYFDLPGGAWERQEEKNRTLRQRVLGNLNEDEAKARSDPFGKKPAEPEKKEGGRGFFGRRKKEDDSSQRTSAGGTWVLNRGNQPDEGNEPVDFAARSAPIDADDDADDWSTEPPLKLTPFPRAESSWGEPDAGWDLSTPAQPGRAADEPIVFARAEERSQGAFDGGGDQEADSDTQEFLSSMRSWAHGQQDAPTEEPPQFRAPTYEEAAATGAWEDEPEADRSPLTLRPRRQDSDEKQLDWNFAPAAWGEEPEARAEDRAPAWAAETQDDRASVGAEPVGRWADEDREDGSEHFTVDPQDEDETFAAFGSADGGDLAAARNDDEPAFAETTQHLEPAPEDDPLESMRRWAERSRDADHPHFTVHHEPPAEEQGAGQPAPIPLRPRAHDEAAPPSSFAPATPSNADDAPRPPLQLPIARGPREEDAEPIHSEKWNDFFAINPKDESAPEDEGAEQGSEGLAAMRAWAQKRPEPEAPGDIPEEFLKPFDWELEEEAPEPAAALEVVPAELLKPFAWESEEPRHESPFELDGAVDPGAVEAAPVAELPVPERAAETASAVEDPLDGIFPGVSSNPREEKKKAGRFGRLFGRGKNKEAAREEELEAITAGDWLLPDDDAPESDIRVAAKLEDWADDAGTVEAPSALHPSGEGWGASLAAGWSNADKDAIQEFSDAVSEPHSEWAPEPDAVLGEVEFESPSAGWESAPAALSIDETPAAPSIEAEQEFSWDPEPVAEEFEWRPETPQDATVAVTDDGPGAQDDAEPEPVAIVEAVASIDTAEEAATPWWEQPAAAPEPEPEAPVEAVASVDTVEEPAPTETPWWERPAAEAEPEPEAPVEAVASVETVEQTETPWWEQPAAEAEAEPEPEAPVEAVASVETVEEPAPTETPWWEQPAAVEAEPEPGAPVEAVASVETVEQTGTPWWERPAAAPEPEPEAPVEAVASVETVEDPAATETPWWEQPAAVEAEPEPEAPVEAVASVETVEEAETPWWEQPAAVEAAPEPEAPVEAVASVDTVEEAETPWWEQPAAEAEAEPEPEAPVEAFASVETVEEPAPTETPWWERPAAEAEAEAEPEPEAPVEAVASVETVEEPAPTETPWWEQPAAVEAEPEPEAPVEAVASVDTAEQTGTPWWEQPAAVEAEPEPEAPVEAVASVETAEQTETPWWEQPAAVEAEPEPEAPVEAVASVETVEESAASETSWWAQPAEPADEVAVAPIEAVAEVVEAPAGVSHDVQPAAAASVAETDDDDPWADFVKTPAAASGEVPPQPIAPRWGHEPARPPSDEDMWGHIAAQAEEHAAADHQLDLAASLESQMADARSAPAHSWNEPEEDEWVAAPDRAATAPSEHEDDDVILAAFERHAATPDAPAARESDEVFAELLGTEAAEIVAEASDEDTDHSFIKMSGWAPQRRAEFDGGWAPEQEVEQALSNSRQPAFGGSDGAGFAPPSWALDEFESGAEATPAAGAHHRTKTWIRELVETGLLALLVFLSVRASFQNFKVEGSSMWPTLENGEFLIVNKLVYSEVDMEKLSNFVPFVDAGSDPKRNVFHGPERGDIIVLKDPRNTETDLIKRVIGLPGETIEIVDGKVYINDHLLEEPYIKAIWHDTKPKVLIPPGEYFVMGDNRDNSLDSRSSQVGLVPQDLIIGKAMLSYWPREKFGLAPNEEGKLGQEKPVLTTKALGE